MAGEPDFAETTFAEPLDEVPIGPPRHHLPRRRAPAEHLFVRVRDDSARRVGIRRRQERCPVLDADLEDFEHLSNYARDLFQLPGMADLVRLPDIRSYHAWLSEELNPKRRVPTGGLPDFYRPHDRHARFDARPRSDAGTQERQDQAGAVGWAGTRVMVVLLERNKRTMRNRL